MEGNGHSESTIPAKDLFRIGEVSRLTATKQFVLRYWETEFPTLQPVKSPKGHRLYRREDIETVLRIKRLLYDEGFTIAGARRHLRDQSGDEGGGHPAGQFDWNAGSSAGSSSGSGAGSSSDLAGMPRAEAGLAGDQSTRPVREAPAILNRKMLLDLRDSLRTFLTLLERE